MQPRYTAAEVSAALDTAIKHYPDTGVVYVITPATTYDLAIYDEVASTDEHGKPAPAVMHVAFVTKDGSGMPEGFNDHFEYALQKEGHRRMRLNKPQNLELPTYKVICASRLYVGNPPDEAPDLVSEWNHNVLPAQTDIDAIVQKTAVAFGLAKEDEEVTYTANLQWLSFTLKAPTTPTIISDTTKRLGIKHDISLPSPRNRIEDACTALNEIFDPYIKAGCMRMETDMFARASVGSTIEQEEVLELRFIVTHIDIATEFLKVTLGMLSQSIDPETRVKEIPAKA